jgi:glutathione synthase/RimK-type ligase-like ATP-grasp enzyme
MREFTDALSDYQQLGGMVVAFKVGSIDWLNQIIYGLYYHPQYGWTYGQTPLPSVVFRRAFRRTEDTSTKLFALTNGNLFNSVRLDKWQMYNRLQKVPAMRPYLPETARLSTATLAEFIEKYSAVIIKPADLSRGRGICIIKTDPAGLLLNDCSQERIFTAALPAALAYLQQNHFFARNYIIQPLLDLATINGSPWDIRVVMQKNQHHEWHCSGIECRLAGISETLTNISRGGQALFINQAVRLAFGSRIHPGKFKREVIEIATKFCRAMDQFGDHFAEFGMDLAVDTNQHYWFIEANVRPSFNGFKRLDYETYYRICQTPLVYAAALAGFEEEGRCR